MAESDQPDEEMEDRSVTEEEFETLRELITKGDVEASIEGDSLLLLALVDGCVRTRFARVPLLSLAHSTADMMKQMGRQEELLALMGLLAKMQMIVAKYVEADDHSGFVEVIDESEYFEELERYRNPLA